MFHVKHFLCNQKIKTIQRKKPHITVRLFARGLDKEMGMSGTDAFAPSESELSSFFCIRLLMSFRNPNCVFNKIVCVFFV